VCFLQKLGLLAGQVFDALVSAIYSDTPIPLVFPILPLLRLNIKDNIQVLPLHWSLNVKEVIHRSKKLILGLQCIFS